MRSSTIWCWAVISAAVVLTVAVPVSAMSLERVSCATICRYDCGVIVNDHLETLGKVISNIDWNCEFPGSKCGENISSCFQYTLTKSAIPGIVSIPRSHRIS